MRNYIGWDKKTHFVFPIEGDVLNNYDGEVKDGKLYIKAMVESDSEVTVNGVKAEKIDGLYVATVCINDGETRLTAKSCDNTDEITVFTVKKPTGYYRLSSDDNIIFLYDINKNKDVYTSIFDNPYLAVYKKAHDLYGAAVHLNIYYEMPATHPGFSGEREYFNLSMMTDKFRDEWAVNSHWLKLNFHAKADKPDMPYKNTDYDTIYRECKRVMDEIVRFAGKNTLSEETTIHWGECTYEGVKAVRELGIKNLAGYFMLTPDEPTVSYFYPKYLVDHICRRDFWLDTELDVFCCKIDKVLNLYSVKENLDMLSVLLTDRAVSGFIEIMIHEEYFYLDFAGYKPDFEALVLEPCRLICEKGYKGAFISEVR